MSKNLRVHITPHMHWDREWYFTTEESRILLVNNLEEIMTRLENDPEYKFYVLDGQTSVLEDYFAIKPSNKERFKALVQAGKLIIGPWYTQTDEMIVSGESILRNLLYGMRDCRPFGEPMKIGYLPDSFGMTSQLPHILNGFDIHRALFWRGCSERHGTDKTEFIWQSNDGSEVIAQVLPLGYAIGKYLPNDKEQLKDRLDKYFPVLAHTSVTKDILLPNGHDQMPIQQNIFEVMDKLRDAYPDYEFLMSRYEEVFEKIEAMRGQLDVIKGEFNDGKYMRVHRTISSTRMDIKIAHAEIENKIVNILEPLASIAWSLGFEYHHGLLERMWKEILKNHAHDSIGCCCSDQVHWEVMARFILANDMADNLIKFYMRKIVDNMPKEEGIDKLALFNLSPYVRDETVNTTIRIRAPKFNIIDENGQPVEYFIRESREIDPGLVDRQIVHYGNYDPFMEYDIQLVYPVPAMGFVALSIVPNQDGKVVDNQSTISAKTMENDFYHITINQDGTLTILDKQTLQTYHKVLEIEDGSDDGDEYDYSPSRKEWLIYSTNAAVEINVEHQAYQSVATIKLNMALPSNLTARENRTSVTGYMDVTTYVTLAKNSRRIDVAMHIDNQADDHRVRVLIPTPYTSETVVADNQFGCITRPVDDPAMQVWQQEDWKEAPIPVWQLMNFAALVDDKQSVSKQGLAIFTNGLREFEIIASKENGQRDTFALTLFRSIGLLGKENLLLRPGRPSGIKLATPDSQMRGKLVCHFSLFSFAGDHIQANVMQHARDYVTPIHCYNKIPYDAMKLNLESKTIPFNYSLMEKPMDGVVLSALKKAEDESALIVRFYNPSENSVIKNDIVKFNQPIKEWLETRMDEVPLMMEKQTYNKGEIGETKFCQSKTFMVKF